ncbi:MAG: hypothetical protein Q9226_005543 [Calogaya cf. arnoldii]
MTRTKQTKKKGKDTTPVAPKDIKGDVTTENELSPKEATAPRSTRKRDGDFNDFEDDEAVLAGSTEDISASPTQPKKKSKTTSAAEKKTKQSKDGAKDIKGDVTTENELSPKDAAAPRSSRKRDGDFNDFEDDEAVLGGPTEDIGASPTHPKKKSKATSAAGKKTDQSKNDAKSVPTEKTHPGGDMVEAEPAEESTTQRKTSRTTAGKSKAAKVEVAAVVVEKASTTKDAASSKAKKEKPTKADAPLKEKKEKPSKTDGHPVVTEKTHPGGDMVEVEPVEESTTQKKPGRKSGGKAKAAKDDQKSAAVEKNVATEEAEPVKEKLKEKKEKPSKTDGHPVVTEKAHPGGDMVEVEPVEESTTQKKTGKKSGGKAKAAKDDQTSTAMEEDVATEEAEAVKEKEAPTKKGERATKPKPSAKVNATEKAAQKGKSKPNADKDKDASNAEEIPSQAQVVPKTTAPKKAKEPTTAEPKSKNQKPKKPTDAEPEADAAKAKPKATKSDKAAGSKDDKEEEPEADTVKGKGKATKSGKAAKPKGKAEADESNKAPEEDSAAAPEEAMDEAPFEQLLKRDRTKIPSVKASANAAEAERKANAATEATKASDKAGKASKAKEPKPASKDKKTTENETAAEASKSAPPKGKKRKEGSDGTDTKADSAPSGKKQKKSRLSAIEAATSAVGDLVSSGMEAAAQGVSAVKDLAAGLGNNSLAEDITAVAEDAVEENSKKAEAKKGDAKKAVKADKGKGKEKAVEEEVAGDGSDVEESEEDDDYEEGDQTMALIKGFDPEEEDDGPSMGEGFKEGQTVPDLPSKKDVEKQLKAVKEGSDAPGVVYVGRIPHGFYEPQMRAYFGQFGHISRLRLSRNRTTGNSKHYAFIEFSSSAVAKIVAETMDNYLMFGHILKCKVVPPGDVHENLWKGANKRFKKVPWSKMEGKKLERKVGREEWGKRVETEKKKREKKSEKLKSIGYEFEPPKLKGPEDVPVREVEGEKSAIEGPAAVEPATIIEEKTIVTTDGGDGTLVISEEVKTTKVKKNSGGKRKAAEEKPTEEGGPLAEIVKKAKKAKKNVA